MAYTKKTLADCLQSLADRHDNGTVPAASATVARYTRFINRGVLYCADRLRMSKKTTIVVTSGVGALPDDFILMNSVFLSTTQISIVDADDGPKQVGNVFWITGNQTDGFVLNTPSDGTYSISYAFRPADMSSNSDVCLIPDIEAPVAYAYAMLRKGESDPFEDAQTSLQECDSLIKEMQSAYSINTDAINFTWD